MHGKQEISHTSGTVSHDTGVNVNFTILSAYAYFAGLSAQCIVPGDIHSTPKVLQMSTGVYSVSFISPKTT